MNRILVVCCLLSFLVPQYAAAQDLPAKRKIVAKSRIVYEAPFSTWPKVENQYGYVGPEGSYYIMEAKSNTWMGPGRFLPIPTPLDRDFKMDISFQVIYKEDCSLNINLSDAGQDYSQMDFFFDIWQSTAPTFSIYENGVQKDFYVDIRRRFAERTPVRQNLSYVDWGKGNTLSIKREGNNVSFLLNENSLHSFLLPAFPVRKLGLGISFKSRILIRSVTARVP